MQERRKDDQQQLSHQGGQAIAFDSVHLLTSILQWASGQGIELLRLHLGRLRLEDQPTRIGNRSTKVCIVDSRAGLYPLVAAPCGFPLHPSVCICGLFLLPLIFLGSINGREIDFSTSPQTRPCTCVRPSYVRKPFLENTVGEYSTVVKPFVQIFLRCPQTRHPGTILTP